ncbi:DDE-type integrase/transposase/recombinase [Qaidamihabitans albus]|uniref:DDE-type integrase/transposase/recombinase n=1 Tax=Qaidamihabitans albus TaxID=2795733 RepID=UPI0018F23075|nr:DDE-type integrase/transposase/recombinase [Qaidamihabitans albus]
MDARFAAAVAAYAGPDGERMNVAATCRALKVSRKRFYKYVRRFEAIGVEGFYPDSRRPRSSPTRLPGELEDVLVMLRKQEADAGWDYGADAIAMRLEERRDELWPPERKLPSRTTINRVLDARGLLAKTPRRRPRRRYRRFARSHVNALWQFDGFPYRLADHRCVVVLHLTDDCSRVDLALQAARSENGEDVWATFCVAVSRYGLPAQVLTDNGSGFSGRRRGWSSPFERRLGELGVHPISARVGHPQTCGKNERAHQRVQKWLARQPRARTLAELQELLDTYRVAYNHRRNRVLDGLTPQQRFDLGPLAVPSGHHEPTHLSHHPVAHQGNIGLGQILIGLGRRHAGKTATVFRTGDHVVIFIKDELVRDLAIDHTRRYQPQDR